MCVLYMSFGSKVRPRTFGCVVQIALILCWVWSEQSACCFSVRLFCFVQTKTLCMYSCIYFLAVLVLVCVDVMVMSSAYAMT